MAQLKDLLVTGATRLIGDAFTNTIQITTINAPTSAGGTTYGPGANGKVLKSNGSSIYWADDSNNTYTLSDLGGIETINGGGTAPLSITATKSGTTVTLGGSISTATTAANGIMTSAMVTKLNGIATGATANTAATAAPPAIGAATTGTSTNYARQDHTHALSTAYLPLAGGTMSGNLNFSNSGGAITWNSDTYQQRIQTTDDSTANTAVFTFQQSSNSGSSWTNLATIKDNGEITATTFTGNLTGTATSATKLSTTGTTAQFWRGDNSWQAVTKANVGLGNVENTALSTWTGNTSISSIGTLSTGTVPWARLSNIPTASTSTAGIVQITAANTNSFLNALTTGSSNPQDADYYISQYAGGGTTTSTYHRRPVSALYNYIKGKIGIDSGTTFLRKDGTWATPTNTWNALTTGQAGYVAQAPNDTSKFLRGDATWAAPFKSGTTVPTTATLAAGEVYFKYS